MPTLPGVRSVYVSASKDYTRLITSAGSILISELEDGTVEVRFRLRKSRTVEETVPESTYHLKRRPKTRTTSGLP